MSKNVVGFLGRNENTVHVRQSILPTTFGGARISIHLGRPDICEPIQL